MGALPWVSIQQSGPDVEPEVVWLEEGMIVNLDSHKKEQQVSASVFYPSCHHDECRDHDCVLSSENHKKGTLITIIFLI